VRTDKANKSKYQILPDLLPDEYESLKSSIAVRGVDSPIIVDQNGEIIDGFQRQKACDDLGVFCPRQVRRFDSDVERLELAVTANCKRRQLNTNGKRTVIANYLKADPAINNNHLAELIGVSRGTVGDVRAELESTCQIQKLTEFRGRDGKTLPRNYARIITNSPNELETALAVVKDLPANGKTLDVTTAARRARRRVKKAERDAKVALPLPDEAIRLYHCPFQQIEQVAGIAPGTVHAIITDPPYGKDFLPQLTDLAAFAARTLVDGGLLVMHSGQYYLDQVIHTLGQHLTYRWMIASV